VRHGRATVCAGLLLLAGCGGGEAAGAVLAAARLELDRGEPALAVARADGIAALAEQQGDAATLLRARELRLTALAALPEGGSIAPDLAMFASAHPLRADAAFRSKLAVQLGRAGRLDEAWDVLREAAQAFPEYAARIDLVKQRIEDERMAAICAEQDEQRRAQEWEAFYALYERAGICHYDWSLESD